jgi:WS/DGAT/MGAT family acyltransferase
LVDSTAALTGAATRPVIRLPFNRPLTGRRRLAWTTLPLDEVRNIGRRRGGTINDVALAVLTDAIGRWLTEGGVQIQSRYLRLLVPVNVRRPDERGLLGNRVSMIPVEVPFEGAPLDRLERTVAHTTAMKRAGIADLVELATQLGDLVPAPLYATALSLAASASLLTWSAAIRSAPFLTANMVCTNVPGPRVPLFVLGRSLVAHYPLVPLAFETGLNCALFTYNQALHVGLVADAGAIDDPDRVIAHLRQAYGDLRAAVAPCDSPVAKEGATRMLGPPVSQESHAPAEATVAHPVDHPSTARPKAARRHAPHGRRREGAGKR